LKISKKMSSIAYKFCTKAIKNQFELNILLIVSVLRISLKIL